MSIYCALLSTLIILKNKTETLGLRDHLICYVSVHICPSPTISEGLNQYL
jgi:hypothetical protein